MGKLPRPMRPVHPQRPAYMAPLDIGRALRPPRFERVARTPYFAVAVLALVLWYLHRAGIL